MSLLARPEEDGAANAPFAAITAKEEDSCVCGGQEASLVGKPVEVAAEFGGGGIGVAQQEGQVSGGVELSGIEGKGVGELCGDVALLAVVVQEGGGAAPELEGESRGVGLPDPVIGAACNAEELAGRGMGGVFRGVNIRTVDGGDGGFRLRPSIAEGGPEGEGIGGVPCDEGMEAEHVEFIGAFSVCLLIFKIGV